MIAQNLALIESRIAAACARAGRPRSEVTLVCVTKTRPIEQVRELLTLGQLDFAENRVQDSRDRIPQLPDRIHWHFIGHLQTNKAKYFPELFSVVHSVDSVEVAQALNKAWEKRPDLPPLEVFLQFNIAEESQKHGAEKGAAAEFLRGVIACSRLHVLGLMCMAPYSENPENARPTFRGLRELRDRLQEECGITLSCLSMGMTGDFEVAIEEGATHVRIGTALFE